MTSNSYTNTCIVCSPDDILSVTFYLLCRCCRHKMSSAEVFRVDWKNMNALPVISTVDCMEHCHQLMQSLEQRRDWEKEKFEDAWVADFHKQVFRHNFIASLFDEHRQAKIRKAASLKSLRKAIRQASIQFHPDQVQGTSSGGMDTQYFINKVLEYLQHMQNHTHRTIAIDVDESVLDHEHAELDDEQAAKRTRDTILQGASETAVMAANELNFWNASLASQKEKKQKADETLASARQESEEAAQHAAKEVELCDAMVRRMEDKVKEAAAAAKSAEEVRIQVTAELAKADAARTAEKARKQMESVLAARAAANEARRAREEAIREAERQEAAALAQEKEMVAVILQALADAAAAESAHAQRLEARAAQAAAAAVVAEDRARILGDRVVVERELGAKAQQRAAEAAAEAEAAAARARRVAAEAENVIASAVKTGKQAGEAGEAAARARVDATVFAVEAEAAKARAAFVQQKAYQAAAGDVNALAEAAVAVGIEWPTASTSVAVAVGRSGIEHAAMGLISPSAAGPSAGADAELRRSQRPRHTYNYDETDHSNSKRRKKGKAKM